MDPSAEPSGTFLLLMFLAAVAPALWLLRRFVTQDVFPEPRGKILLAFFLGMLTIPFVVALGDPIQTWVDTIGDPYLRGFLDALCVAAIPEEGFKLLVVAGVCARWADFDEPMDGLVYGATASLGFACLENIFYVMDSGIETAILRALTAVPAHACCGVVMGHFVAQWRFGSSGRLWALFCAFAIPTFLHTIYDTPLLTLGLLDPETQDSLAPFVLLFVAILVWLMMRWSRARFKESSDAQRSLITSEPAPPSGGISH